MMDLTLTGSSSLVFLLKKLLGCFTVCAENRTNNNVYLIYANKYQGPVQSIIVTEVSAVSYSY